MTATPALIFGRGPGADVVVPDDYASPRHCLISYRLGRYFVEDLGSTNGTRIVRAGREIKVYGPTPLLPGDRVRIGRTILPWEAR
jgi:pSer/pThr/pTyr-binding forkhead associated (FHA) protein